MWRSVRGGSNWAAAGTDSLLPVLPATASRTGVFAPTSDQSWLTIGTIANGVVSFSFSANMSTSRVAHIAILGQQITVTQSAAPPAVVSLTPSSGQGATPSFVATFSDATGAAAITVADLLIQAASPGATACYVVYLAGSNQIGLVNDAGTAVS